MNWFTALTFLLPFSYSCVALLKEKHAMSFRCFFFLFALFFYSVAAHSQFYEPVSPLYTVEVATFEEINLILFCCYILFDIIYYSTFNKISLSVKNYSTKLLSNQGIVFFLILDLLICFFVFKENSFDLNNLFFRGGDENIDRVEHAQSVGLVLGFLRMNISIILALFLIKTKLFSGKMIALFFMLFFLAPSSMSRFYIAAAYIPVILLMVPALQKSRWLFKWLMLVGVLMIFPMLNVFRTSEHYEYELEQSVNMFSSLHFDSYTSFAFVYEHEIITWGQQLLGSLFFWVPRSMWPDKPIGSGAMVAQDFQLFAGNFSNISMNYLGEGYVNFGLLGVFLFLVVLALVSKKMDATFWVKYNGNINNPFTLYYLYGLGMLFFILRGDLLSGTAFLTGTITMVFVVQKISGLFTKDTDYGKKITSN